MVLIIMSDFNLNKKLLKVYLESIEIFKDLIDGAFNQRLKQKQ